MKKQSLMSMGSSNDAGKKEKKGNNKGEESEEVPIDHLSSLIQKEIEELYRVFGENDAVLEAKPTLEILMDIESRFMTLTETIQFICKNPPSNAEIVKGLEADRKR